MIVCGGNLVTGRVGKLKLDVVMGVPLFVKDRRGKPPESVACHASLVPHVSQSSPIPSHLDRMQVKRK
jgi:hypothetical protein